MRAEGQVICDKFRVLIRLPSSIRRQVSRWFLVCRVSSLRIPRWTKVQYTE